jgi:dipeptidyl aminopeptidase/acylaminoacyl peptidase
LEIPANGGKPLRLTNGKEQGICFRIVPQGPEQEPHANFSGGQYGKFNLVNGLLLRGKGKGKNGYFQWKPKGIAKIVFEGHSASQITKAGADTYAYVEQDYNLPPRLVVLQGGETKVLFQSNPQHAQYKWGTQEVIAHTNPFGKTARAILYYPADFNPKNKYPMIVRIYQKQVEERLTYNNPSLYSGEGFNTTNFTSHGYFLLLPDIEYQIGNPGKSAAGCVIAATKSALSNPAIDPAKIGLIGHSFGGYETNFIVTQTEMFAAAVAGSGITDFTSNYLNASMGNGMPDHWRYENGQMRMAKSLLDDRAGYGANSPLTFVREVKTPLLLWSGLDDVQVPHTQSMEFYLALRRLNKPCVLLLYEGERHALMQRDHQIDLAHKMLEWFDCYLKGKPKAGWMNPDFLQK